jgi:hypothetical protein
MVNASESSTIEELHFDSGTIYKTEMTPEGFLRLHMTIAKAGELKYYNKDGSERVEVVTPEVLFDAKSIDSFKMKPLTNPNHPPVMLNADNAKHYSKGMTGNLVTLDGDFLGIVATVTDSEAIKNIQSGKTREVSCGYLAGTRQRSDGKFDQLYRMGNHITICERGRAGSDVKVSMDSAEDIEFFISEPIKQDSQPETIMSTIPASAQTLETITLKLDDFSSIAVPVSYAKEISDRFNKDASSIATSKARIVELEKELQDEKTKLVNATKEKTDSEVLLAAKDAALETLTKERDTLQAKVDQLEESAKAQPKQDEATNQPCISCYARKCDGLLPAGFKIDSSTTIRGLQEAVLLNKTSLTTLEGKTDAYIEARFDGIVEEHEKRDTSAPLVAASRQATSPSTTPTVREDTLAWAEMVLSMTKPQEVTTK